MSCYVRVSHCGQTNFIALSADLPTEELSSVLGAAFRVRPSEVIGLVDSVTNAVLPLSLAAMDPERFVSTNEWRLLLDQSNPASHAAAAPAYYPAKHQQGLAAPVVPSSQLLDASFQSPAADSNNSVASSNAAVAASVSTDTVKDVHLSKVLTAFVSKLCSNSTISSESASTLVDLIDSNDSVIAGAYKVAEWTQDANYFKDALVAVARNFERGGNSVQIHQALEDLLQIADAVRESGAIDPGQYIALVNAVLIQDDMIVAAYEAYKMDDAVDELVDTVRQIGTLLDPIEQAPVESSRSGGRRASSTNSPADRPAPVSLANAVAAAANALVSEGRITKEAARFLVSRDGLSAEVVYAAYEKFLHDADQHDLKDTLLRYIIVTLRGEIEEDNDDDYDDDENDGQYDDDEDEDEDEEVEDYDDDEDEDDEDEEEEEEEEEEEDDDNNNNNDVVPIGFQNAVVLLCKHGKITQNAAKALLTAMAKGNKVLKTIYEAFTINKDAASFLSLIVRLVSSEPTRQEANPPEDPSPPSEKQFQVTEELQKNFDSVFSQCLQLLLAKKMVTTAGAHALTKFSRSHMIELMELLEDFNTDADLEKLLQTLSQLAEYELKRDGVYAPSAPPQEPSSQLDQGTAEKDEEQEDNDDDDDDDDDDDEVEEEDEEARSRKASERLE